MSWIIAAVGLAFAGLVVLAVLSLRVLVAARALGRELARTRARLAAQNGRTPREASDISGAGG
ncbi:hypothetical protein [Thermostaphylospora chromogena]|uniref:Uncharacterized protein n=1 Tax=Thermostaphylospora chromogena TaxID=35622 RepID=A0A1H1HHJ6_9ACTN|nr:hypothetical protein [Thermostaphylospora chromogena]SDR24893.1 hypothetical protein SAMN04489764_4446 [Thermostaphylospora chromogena]